MICQIYCITFQANHYKILGSYAAVSVIQGGPGFPFFHPHVYAYLCTGIWSPVSIAVEHLPNQTLRTVVKNVSGYSFIWDLSRDTLTNKAPFAVINEHMYVL